MSGVGLARLARMAMCTCCVDDLLPLQHQEAWSDQVSGYRIDAASARGCCGLHSACQHEAAQFEFGLDPIPANFWIESALLEVQHLD